MKQNGNLRPMRKQVKKSLDRLYVFQKHTPSISSKPCTVSAVFAFRNAGAQFNSDSENDSENNYENDSEILPESNIKKFKNLKFRHV